MIRIAQHGFSQLSLNETSSRENRGEDVSGFIKLQTRVAMERFDSKRTTRFSQLTLNATFSRETRGEDVSGFY